MGFEGEGGELLDLVRAVERWPLGFRLGVCGSVR